MRPRASPLCGSSALCSRSDARPTSVPWEHAASREEARWPPQSLKTCQARFARRACRAERRVGWRTSSRMDATMYIGFERQASKRGKRLCKPHSSPPPDHPHPVYPPASPAHETAGGASLVGRSVAQQISQEAIARALKDTGTPWRIRRRFQFRKLRWRELDLPTHHFYLPPTSKRYIESRNVHGAKTAIFCGFLAE